MTSLEIGLSRHVDIVRELVAARIPKETTVRISKLVDDLVAAAVVKELEGVTTVGEARALALKYRANREGRWVLL